MYSIIFIYLAVCLYESETFNIHKQSHTVLQCALRTGIYQTQGHTQAFITSYHDAYLYGTLPEPDGGPPQGIASPRSLDSHFSIKIPINMHHIRSWSLMDSVFYIVVLLDQANLNSCIFNLWACMTTHKVRLLGLSFWNVPRLQFVDCSG